MRLSRRLTKKGWPPRNGSYKKNIFLYHLKP